MLITRSKVFITYKCYFFLTCVSQAMKIKVKVIESKGTESLKGNKLKNIFEAAKTGK